MLKVSSKTPAKYEILREIAGLDFCPPPYVETVGGGKGRVERAPPLSSDKLLSHCFLLRMCKWKKSRASWNRCLISLNLPPKESRSQFGVLMFYLSLSTDGYFYWYYFVYLASRKVSPGGRCLHYESTFLRGS